MHKLNYKTMSYTAVKLYSDEYSDRDDVYLATIWIRIEFKSKCVDARIVCGQYKTEQLLVSGRMVNVSAFMAALAAVGVYAFDVDKCIAAIDNATVIEITLDEPEYGPPGHFDDWFSLVSDAEHIPPTPVDPYDKMNQPTPAKTIINPEFFKDRRDRIKQYAASAFKRFGFGNSSNFVLEEELCEFVALTGM